jgi:mannose-6-phosphate isomerase-like protein (cupin superfamily)
MNKADIISQVKTLGLSDGTYVVFGSCPMAAAGIREAGDIDLYVTPKVLEEFKQKGWKKVVKGPGDEPYMDGVFEAHGSWDFSHCHYNPTFQHLLKNSELIDGVRFASLEEVRRWKAGSEGEKHANDARLIEKYLKEKGQVAAKDPEEVAAVWKVYVDTGIDWQELVKGVTPKATGCGLVYELSNPIDRPDESFAIADMREIAYAEPHYHTNDETEIYIAMTGSGTVVVGGRETHIEPGSVCIIYPETAHFTIPEKDLVLAVINTPSFSANNVVTLDEGESKAAVGYNAKQLDILVAKA